MKFVRNSKHKCWIYGVRAALAALENPRRTCHALLMTSETHKKFRNHPALEKRKALSIDLVTREDIDALVGPHQTHQGIALNVAPLPSTHLEDICRHAEENTLIVLLDQVTDPHNVGAILRSAAAFGVKAVFLPDRNAPDPTNGIIAKTASGAVEKVPLISVKNLSRTLETLKKNDFWIIGLSEHGKMTLAEGGLTGRRALVLGSEEKGLRPLTERTCDLLTALPTAPDFPTLNVSNAAAIALYSLTVDKEKK